MDAQQDIIESEGAEGHGSTVKNFKVKVLQTISPGHQIAATMIR
jgi:hypothetical protein